jgi:hypothetical protein
MTSMMKRASGAKANTYAHKQPKTHPLILKAHLSRLQTRAATQQQPSIAIPTTETPGAADPFDLALAPPPPDARGHQVSSGLRESIPVEREPPPRRRPSAQSRALPRRTRAAGRIRRRRARVRLHVRFPCSVEQPNACARGSCSIASLDF